MTANCANYPDPEVFFDSERVEEAKAICAGCPLQIKCHIEGAAHEDGVWGGVEIRPLIETNPVSDEILFLHDVEGLGFQEIADLLGFKSAKSVSKRYYASTADGRRRAVARQYGLGPKADDLDAKRAERKKRVLGLIATGVSQPVVAQKVGCSVSTVRDIVRADREAA